MNPYETTNPTQNQPQRPSIWSWIKRVGGFLIVIIFFTGCFKIANDTQISETTKISEMMSISLFHGVFVWPMAQIIIWTHKLLGSTLATIFIVTMINRGIGSTLTLKSTMEAEKMKELQPLINNINAKYGNTKDRALMMQKNMELNKLFQKHNVNPMGSIGTIFVSAPLFMSIYVAIRNNAYIAETNLFGIKTSTTTSEALTGGNFNIMVLVFVIALVVLQWFSIKLPQHMNKKNNKNRNQPSSGMQKNMEIIIPMMMLLVSWRISIALLVYFTFSPIFTMAQSVLIHNYIAKKKEKEKKSINQLY